MRELFAPTNHLWYIGGLGLLTLSVPLLRRVPPGLALAITGVAALWHTLGGRTGVHGYDQLLHFAVFFYTGLYGREPLLALLARCGRRMGALAGAGIVVLITAPLPHSMVTLGAAALILPLVQGLTGGRAGAVLAWFGRRTPDIYLAHVPILLIAGRLAGSIDATALACLVPATIAACLLLRQAADRLHVDWLYKRPQVRLTGWLRWEPVVRAASRAGSG